MKMLGQKEQETVRKKTRKPVEPEGLEDDIEK